MKRSNFRWVICSLLFFATTVNYMDRQVLSLTWKDFIAPEFHWTDADYGVITGAFSILYACCSLFVGKIIDMMGNKRGYLTAIFVWSVGACLHAACGWGAMQWVGIESAEALAAVETGSGMALAIASVSVWLFLFCRGVLALGEAGNFPSAIKVTAEYFPKKDRAFATSIFNSGASIGALVAPITIPVLAEVLGWEMAFIIIGALGFLWMGFWMFYYDSPEHSKHVNEGELEYIRQDVAEQTEPSVVQSQQPTASAFQSYLRCFTFRQTWAFVAGKFMTDGVWWFYLFWAPAYFSDQFGYKSSSAMGQVLIFTLYAIVTVISIGGGYLPRIFIDRFGMNPYAGRMRAMLIFAFFPLLALFAQPMALWQSSPIDPAWWPALIIGLAGAGHQAWSANLYSTIGDMLPNRYVATITGIGTTAGGIASMLINTCAGKLFTFSEAQGSAFSFLGYEGKDGGYMIIFCICAVAYLCGWIVMKTLVPRFKIVNA